MDAAVHTVGPEGVVIVDSLSHAWNSSGGVLEIKAGIAAQPNKNSYTAWDEAGRIQNDFINYLLSVNCHTICTLRVKQDYVLTENDRGKQVPVKVGMAPVQRDDVEYEFDLMLNIGRDHIATASKDVTFLDGPERGHHAGAGQAAGRLGQRGQRAGALRSLRASGVRHRQNDPCPAGRFHPQDLRQVPVCRLRQKGRAGPSCRREGQGGRL